MPSVDFFQMTQRRTFVADHFHDRPGFMEARHGHNWEIEATAALAELRDAPRLERALEDWVRLVNYRLLNDLDGLAGRNPTAEALAQWAFEFLVERGLDPRCVKIREKANYWAACRGGAA